MTELTASTSSTGQVPEWNRMIAARFIKSEPASSNDTACPLQATRTITGNNKRDTKPFIKSEPQPVLSNDTVCPTLAKTNVADESVTNTSIKSEPATSNDTACPLLATTSLAGADTSVTNTFIKSEPVTSNDTACPLMATRSMAGADKSVTNKSIKFEPATSNDTACPLLATRSLAGADKSVTNTSIKSEAATSNDTACPLLATTSMAGADKSDPRTVMNGTPSLKYRCRQCSFTSSDRCQYNDHYRMHEGTKKVVVTQKLCLRKFACRECSFKCEYADAAIKHYYMHRGVSKASIFEPPTSLTCSTSKPTSQLSERPFSYLTSHACPKCPFTCEDSWTLESHLQYHGKQPPDKLQCYMCDYSTVSQQGLQSHRQLYVAFASRVMIHTGTKNKAAPIPIYTSVKVVVEDITPALNGHDDCPPSTAGRTVLEADYSAKPKFKCPHCPKEYIGVSNLKTHLSRHDRVPPGRYPCRECTYSADAINHINEHEKLHNITSDHRSKRHKYKCPFCPKVANARYLIRLHLANHDRVPPGIHRCRECSFSTNARNHAAAHKNSHKAEEATQPASPNKTVRRKLMTRIVADDVQPDQPQQIKKGKRWKPAPCPLCPKVSYNSGELKKHLRCHDRVPPGRYSCRDCTYSTKNINHIKEHEKLHNESTSSTKCEIPPQCPSLMTTIVVDEVESVLDQPQQIKKRKRSKPKPAPCPLCPKVSYDSGELKKHLRCHNRVPPGRYPCRDCTYSTKNINHIKEHEKLHNESTSSTNCEIPSSCSNLMTTIVADEVESGLDQPQQIMKRKRSKPEPAPRPLCPKVSHDRGELKKHLRCHNRVPPGRFPCRECTYSTRNINHIKEHEKLHNESTPSTNCEIPSPCPNLMTTIVADEVESDQPQQIKKRKRSKPEPAPCPSCPKVSRSSSELRTHLLGHDRVPPGRYPCRECTYSTINIKYFKEHEKLHNATTSSTKSEPESSNEMSCPNSMTRIVADEVESAKPQHLITSVAKSEPITSEMDNILARQMQH